MVIIDPVTRQRIVAAKHIGDIEYELEGDDAIVRTNIPLIGPWIGRNGSDLTVNSRNQQMWAGHENDIQGSDPSIESKERLPELDVEGKTKRTHRRDVIRRYKRLDDK